MNPRIALARLTTVTRRYRAAIAANDPIEQHRCLMQVDIAFEELKDAVKQSMVDSASPLRHTHRITLTGEHSDEYPAS